jgi:hypothetical protein
VVFFVHEAAFSICWQMQRSLKPVCLLDQNEALPLT